MKQFISTFLLLFCILVNIQAQDITGKWKCSKIFLAQLGLDSDDIKGYYKFKKDSTYSVRINVGPMKRPNSGYPSRGGRSIYIKVSGRFYVADGKITTMVSPKNIKCDVDAWVIDPDFPDTGEGARVSAASYDSAVAMATFQENTIRTELKYIWEWNSEPFTITSNSMIIGDKVELRK